MYLKLLFFWFTFLFCTFHAVSQYTIKVRKGLKIEGLYRNTQTKSSLPSYLYFTKEGVVYYTFSKKLKEKKALVKLTLCAKDSSCDDYPSKQYELKKEHIRFTTSADIDKKHFIIYDGQLSEHGTELSIRKEESNQLIIVNKYTLIEPKK
jgi:hypothetical protein